MAEIERKAIHVQITYDEAIQGRKNLLEIERSILKIMKNFKSFKALDREEGRYMGEIRRIVRTSHDSFEKMLDFLPKEKEEEKPIFRLKRKKFEERPGKADKIESELLEIQEKLKKLGG